MRVHTIGKMLALVAASALLPVAAAWADPQTKDQQKCINKMNKDGIKVQAAQGKENAECVKRKANDELGASQTGSQAEACLIADGKGKVGKKRMKTDADETKFCQADPPDFGHTNTSDDVNDAAQEAELDLIHDIFGPAPVDAGLFSKNPHVNEAVCQRNVIDRVEKLVQTMGREFVKCKKNALAVGKEPFLNGAASAADLETCVNDPGTPGSVLDDAKNKIADRKQNLLDTITDQCDPGGFSEDPFGGACAGLSSGAAAPLRDCLADLAECRFCQFVNEADSLAIDCGVFAGTTAAACD